MSALLEVRVLSGLHERASCLAANGAVVGADPSCDIVLADQGIAPRAAQLRIGDQGWALASNDDEAAPESFTPFNQPLALGPIWITVARRTDEWVPLPAANDEKGGVEESARGADPQSRNEETVEDASQRDGESERDAASTDQAAKEDAASDATVGETHAGTQQDAPTAPDSNVEPVPATETKRRSTWLIIVSILCLILAVMVAIMVAALPSRSTPVQIADPVESTATSVGRISAVIDRLGLASRLHVAVDPAGTIVVQGWVRDADEHEALAAALSQIWPMPALRVSNADAALVTAQGLLSAFSVVLTPRYEGDGRMSVHGVVASGREHAAALDALRAHLPGITILDGDIHLAADVSRELSDEFAQAGLSGVGLSWQAHRLEVNASGLATGQLPALREVLDAFNARHFDVAALSQAVSAAETDTVPFVIRSVVGGPQPFIVLQDGSKLLEGGSYQGYRLQAVEADRLVFDGPRPAVIMR